LKKTEKLIEEWDDDILLVVFQTIKIIAQNNPELIN
jgi:hypothetical protein